MKATGKECGGTGIPLWWSGLQALLLGAGSALWLAVFLGEVVPQSYSGWSLMVPIDSQADGVARLYYAVEKGGITEENTIDCEISAGGSEVVRFNLPRTDLAELRIDPVDVKTRFRLGDPVLAGPWHRELEEKEQRVSLRRERGINIDAVEGDWFHPANEDPHFYLSIKNKPLLLPNDAIRQFQQLGWKVAGIAGLLAGVIWWWLVGRGDDLARREILARLMARVSLASALLGVSLFFVWPERRLDPSTLYAWSLGPLLLASLAAACGLAARPPALRQCRWSNLGWRHLPACLCIMLLLLLALHALALDGTSQPSRGVVLLSLATLFGLFASAGLWHRFQPSLGKLTSRFLVGLVTVAGALTLWRLDWFYAPDWNMAKRFADVCYFPLHRSISGSAACAVILIAFLGFATVKLRGPQLWLAFVGALPFCLWIFMAQSRGVMLASSGTLLLLLWAVPNWRSLAVVLAWLGLAGVIFLTPLPAILTSALAVETASVSDDAPAILSSAPPLPALATTAGTSESLPAGGVALSSTSMSAPENLQSSGGSAGGVTALPASSPTAPSALKVSLLREDPVRFEIWKTYWKRSLERPLLGNGFGHEHTLRVLARPDASMEDALKDADWSVHNVHLSFFFFCGIVGVTIQGALLVLIWWQGAFRFRQHGDLVALVLGLLAAFAGVALFFESTLMAYDKDAVLLRFPNEYWLIYWLPVVVGAAWLSAPRQSGRTRTDAKPIATAAVTKS